MSISLVQRLRFDATRCEATFSKGVASNIEEAAKRLELLEDALHIARGALLCIDTEYSRKVADDLAAPFLQSQ